MNFDFYMPVRVVSGRTALADSAAQLKKLGDSCMVVTGKHSAKASGALDDLTEVLRREKISCTVYDGITENPLLSSCEEAAALAAEKKAAFVVGIGGGSPLDAAKAIAALAANPAARLCISAIALETLQQAIAALTAHGLTAQVTQIAVSRSRAAGSLHLLMANNPVFLIARE